MSIVTRPMFLRHFRLASSKSRPDPDLADMGTAFGLDEALDDAPGYDTLAPQDSPRAPRPLPVPAWRRWLGRTPAG